MATLNDNQPIRTLDIVEAGPSPFTRVLAMLSDLQSLLSRVLLCACPQEVESWPLPAGHKDAESVSGIQTRQEDQLRMVCICA